MEDIEQWLNVNHLKINHAKTSIIIFRTEHIICSDSFNLNDKTYDACRNARLLGVIVDDCIKSDEQIDTVRKRNKQFVLRIFTFKYLVTSPIVWVACYGYCYPLLKFGIVVWRAAARYSACLLDKKNIAYSFFTSYATELYY